MRDHIFRANFMSNADIFMNSIFCRVESKVISSIQPDARVEIFTTKYIFSSEGDGKSEE